MRGTHVCPAQPEQPLIRVIENRESGHFDAVFGLDLAGVTRRENIRESYSSDERQGVDAHLHCSSLLAGMSEGQKLDFVYTGGRNQKGQEFFNWEIIGHSIGISTKEAAHKAKQLCRSLSVFLGSAEDYCFDHVKDPERLDAVQTERQWMAEIQPSGIAIDGGQTKEYRIYN